MDTRLDSLKQWLTSLLKVDSVNLSIASGDASFRRYFRLHLPEKTQIVMDAPPDKEDSSSFISIANEFEKIGLNVPHITSSNLQQGFLLLSDLGSTQYLEKLTDQTVERLYGDALSALMTLQACGPRDNIPAYDRPLLIQEMELFRDWYLKQHLVVELSDRDNVMLNRIFEVLCSNALAQPRVCVHRDYHSRNLMFTKTHNPGILDFQDAVLGPVTYDLVSLLRDCYIQWSNDQVEDWVKGFHELSIQSGIIDKNIEFKDYLKWFDLMGVQRHLKAIGIFSRLNYRDGKSGYLKDIPRTMQYVVQVCNKYDELNELSTYLNKNVNQLTF
ncbi:MAG: phosphotransferase [Methylococcales bacterium]|jgi:N-acetylmuramate 1-kinase|nr:phosphotransferase [Methylococcales bacterium]MBT7409435.1 phosphotransferase [Methylococcales bacterium]